MASANIYEVFSGIQGEGIHVGRRQLFIRFCGCNRSCRYCDTPESRQAILFAHIERPLGSRSFELQSNPISSAGLAARIGRLDPNRTHASVSLTGGEPLLAANFLAELILQCDGRRFCLETNGSLPTELKKVADLVETVAMDIKLPSAAGRGSDPETSREFLAVAAKSGVFVKVVVCDKTSRKEITEAAGIVASVSGDIPFVIQPVTPVSAEMRPPDEDQTLELQMSALDVLGDVRVIPQVHKLMGQK